MVVAEHAMEIHGLDVHAEHRQVAALSARPVQDRFIVVAIHLISLLAGVAVLVVV